jgi:hypothetical protein
MRASASNSAVASRRRRERIRTSGTPAVTIPPALPQPSTARDSTLTGGRSMAGHPNRPRGADGHGSYEHPAHEPQLSAGYVCVESTARSQDSARYACGISNSLLGDHVASVQVSGEPGQDPLGTDRYWLEFAFGVDAREGVTLHMNAEGVFATRYGSEPTCRDSTMVEGRAASGFTISASSIPNSMLRCALSTSCSVKSLATACASSSLIPCLCPLRPRSGSAFPVRQRAAFGCRTHLADSRA